MLTENAPADVGLRRDRLPAATDTRHELLAAALRLMRRHGVAAFTTRDIAREAGVSDGALYTHFRTKEDLLLEVCQIHVPEWAATLERLLESVGQGSVEEHLVRLGEGALRFYDAMSPLMSGIGADRTLLERNRARWKELGGGPARSGRALTAYLRAEQGLGRVPSGTDAAVLAQMFLGACSLRVTMATLLGDAHEPAPPDNADYIAAVVSVLLGTAPSTSPRVVSAGTPDTADDAISARRTP